jgi:NTE family protein
MGFMTRLYSGEGSADEARREIGKFSLAAKTVSEEDFIGTFGRMVGEAAWPSKRYLCTAVDTADGSFATWDNDSGVPLGRAVASSCSVPGIYPPITINGKRYMDGGMRSGTNADMAKDYDRVIVVAVRAGTMAQQSTPMGVASSKRLDEEMGVIRAAGGEVELIVPDEDAVGVLGLNLMDFRQREPALDAGIRQGRAEAARLKAFWG